MATRLNDNKLKKSNVISDDVKDKCKRINVNDVLVWTGSEDLLANAGITNLHAYCHTPSNGSNEDYSDTLSFYWDDIDNLNIKGYYKIARRSGGDTHSDHDFKIQVLVNGSWETVWSALNLSGWDTGTWDIDITINTEGYTGPGAIRCYCYSYWLTTSSIKSYLDIDISGLTTNVY